MEYFDINLHESIDINNNVITNPIHLFLQEIELAVKIGPNSIWGTKLSIDLNRYLFNQYITLNQIKNEITFFIDKECEQAKNYKYDIDVQIINFESKDLIYIEVTIYNLSNEKEFVQKFLLGQ